MFRLLASQVMRPTVPAMFVAVLAAILGAAPVAAYNGGAAAAWADSHATSYNCNQYPCDSLDCQNFVSLAMNIGGGYPQVIGTGIQSDDHLWFNTKNGLGLWVQSWSWANVMDQYNFQVTYHKPGGTVFGTAPGTALYSGDGLAPGDELFFDWDSNGTLDHTGIQTTDGIDPQLNKYGDLLDEHTSDRARVWWSLYPYNSQRNTTRITEVHISPAN